MRIATIYTLYGRRAGAELCFEATIKAVVKKYSDVEWIVFCNDEVLVSFEKHDRITLVRVGMLNNQYKKAIWLEFFAKRIINKYIPDCFWIPSGCNHFPGKWDIPILTTFHDFGEYHIKNKYSISRMIFRKKICIPLNIKRANFFTTVSQYTANDLVKLFSVSMSKIAVVYNGASPHTNVNIEESEAKLQKFGLVKGQYFFTPGRTDYFGKGLDFLFNTFRLYKDTNIKLVLVGPKGEGYNLMVTDLSQDDYINRRVVYLGRVSDEDLVLLYKNCLATIISSRFEGFGFPVLEAMEIAGYSIGAEKLLGKGDMLYFPSGAPKPSRVQGAFVSDDEVEKIVDFIKSNGTATYSEDIIESIENSNKTEKELTQEQAQDDETDPFLMDAIQTVVETGQASTSFIQRRFKVGYARAGRIIDQMEERGVISGYQGSKPREVLMTLDKLNELKMGTEARD